MTDDTPTDDGGAPDAGDREPAPDSWNSREDDRALYSEELQESREDTDDGDSSDETTGDDASWLSEHKKTLAATFGSVAAVTLGIVTLWVAPPLWRLGLIAFIVGIVPGALLFPWVTSPFGPGLWVLSEPFARIHFTISQVIRKTGVLVKRASDNYELGTYVEESGEAVVSDGTVSIDDERTRWGLFGKRRLGVAWELGTDVYERISVNSDDVEADVETAADGGDGRVVNLNAAHRLFEGANEADVISRTKEHAEAEYGGGDDGLAGLVMAMLVMLMLLLGSATTYFML